MTSEQEHSTNLLKLSNGNERRLSREGIEIIKDDLSVGETKGAFSTDDSLSHLIIKKSLTNFQPWYKTSFAV